MMPVSARRSPFNGGPPVCPDPPPAPRLRTPQARVLAALMPVAPDDPPEAWPLLTRAALGLAAGYTAISGSTTRALNGILPGSSSGDAHPGLLTLGYVEEVTLDIDGLAETNYRATPTGVRAYRAYMTEAGALPKLRDRDACTNHRYKGEDDR